MGLNNQFMLLVILWRYHTPTSVNWAMNCIFVVLCIFEHFIHFFFNLLFYSLPIMIPLRIYPSSKISQLKTQNDLTWRKQKLFCAYSWFLLTFIIYHKNV